MSLGSCPPCLLEIYAKLCVGVRCILCIAVQSGHQHLGYRFLRQHHGAGIKEEGQDRGYEAAHQFGGDDTEVAQVSFAGLWSMCRILFQTDLSVGILTVLLRGLALFASPSTVVGQHCLL